MSDTARLDDVSIGIEATVMAIREELMEYFKGTCVRRMTSSSIYLQSLSDYRPRNYQYQRRELQNQQPRLLMISSTPVATLTHAPDTVRLHVAVLRRSPQLREVRRGIEAFMDKYLAGVKREEDDNAVIFD